MNYTNKYNLPDYACKWLRHDTYDYQQPPAGLKYISATSLLKPVRSIWLTHNYPDREITLDISDLIAARFGTAIHQSFEDACIGDRYEERHTRRYGHWIIGGKFDFIINNQLHDIKTTSVYKWINKDYQHYIEQLSIYRWLLHPGTPDISDKGKILFIFTDWSAANKLRKGREYPACKMAEAEIDLMPIAEIESFIYTKLEILDGLTLDTLPECSSEELWATPDKWAVKKAGGSRALKLYEDKGEAHAALKAGQEIEYRPGTVRRCAYCDARSVCTQFDKLVQEGRIER